MLVPKANRVLVYTKLFEEGVMVVEKNPFAPKHMELDVPNLQAMKLCQSLESKGFVKGQFNWNHHYYFLTDAGIEYLRGYLNIPSNTVPKTLVRKQRTAAPGAEGGEGAPRGERGERGERGKRVGAGGDFRPEFRKDDGYRSEPRQGGFGRKE
mmetsp:Transcript_2143/g.3862  ORF Transcript_2143/g.3862 Transcript_2143/m.3862 type:complete len:153 (+) Transcript_2143:88-546(+)